MSDLVNDARTKVLIAEDDTIVALDLQGMVMRLGYDVVAIVENGKASIAAARRFLPDIILLDMSLSGPPDAIEVAREINAFSSVPVVFCISSPDLAMLVRAKEISYAGYLLKPINPDSLSTTLDTVLYKYKLEKRVKEAEERFRQLTEKYGVVRYFFDQSAACELKWDPVSGAHVLGYSGIDLSMASLEDKIGSRMAAHFAADRDSGVSGKEVPLRISTVFSDVTSSGVTVELVLLGVRNPETGQVSGMIIPLDGDVS